MIPDNPQIEKSTDSGVSKRLNLGVRAESRLSTTQVIFVFWNLAVPRPLPAEDCPWVGCEYVSHAQDDSIFTTLRIARRILS